MTMSRADCDALLAEVRANQAKLAACSGPHSFRPIGEELKLFAKQRCACGGGGVASDQALWYKRGLAHGDRGG